MNTVPTATAPVYRSTVPYDSSRIHAAAIYCSDGRVGEHFDDFLHNGLRLPRYDRVALPGGPGVLSPTLPRRLQARAVLDELKFLIEVHGLTRLVLIAHEACAFYSKNLELEGSRAEAVQRTDLVRAADHIREATGLLAIEAYFARRLPAGMGFERIET